MVSLTRHINETCTRATRGSKGIDYRSHSLQCFYMLQRAIYAKLRQALPEFSILSNSCNDKWPNWLFLFLKKLNKIKLWNMHDLMVQNSDCIVTRRVVVTLWASVKGCFQWKTKIHERVTLQTARDAHVRHHSHYKTAHANSRHSHRNTHDTCDNI